MGKTVYDGAFVFFWQLEEDNEEFSNFYPCRFKVEGVMYNCVEQYMMSRKALLFGDAKIFRDILDECDPGKIKALGRQIRGFDSDVWDRCKWEIVYNGNYAKYSQNAGLRNKLIGTGSATLAEASPKDKIWGIGLDCGDPLAKQPDQWKGENLLGRILEEIRGELIRSGSSCIHRHNALELDEYDLELLQKVDRKTLEECIRDISAIEEIEWSGGPTGEKDAQGRDILQWPLPKYPECVFTALKILGRGHPNRNMMEEISALVPYEMSPYQIKVLFGTLGSNERFGDGLIAGYVEDGTILTCLEQIQYLLEGVNEDGSR